MLKIIRRIGVVVGTVVLVAILAGQSGAFRGADPTDLGVRSGRLKPPSLTPNSVSSQADLYPDHVQRSYASIAPLAYSGDGTLAMQRLAALVRNAERTEVIRQEPGYLYARCTTALMRFTDDLEFWLDEAHHVIHVRSASRLGAKDFGVNRQRVETIRAQFQKN